MFHLIFILFTTLSLATVISEAQSPTVQSLCQLTTQAQASDGKSFTIQSLYAHTFHGALITDDACPSVKANVTLISGYRVSASTLKALNTITRKGDKAVITFHAVFRASHQEQCFGKNCELFQVEIDEIISVRKATLPAEGAAGSEIGVPDVEMLL